MSFIRSTALAAGGLLISATAALAGPTYTFTTSEGGQPSNVGTITLTQINATTVDVFVDLADAYGFVNTVGPHTPFAFTLAGSESGVSANFLQPAGGSFASGMFSLSTTNGDATPYGTFGISINSTAGNGTSQAYFGDLKFDVTRSSGLSTDDFVSNPAFAYFAADLTNGSNTGSQAWKSRALGLSFSVQLQRYVPASGNQAIVALATASDASGPISLDTAASELGVDHFNWIQFLTSDPDLTACAGKTFPTGSSVCDALTTISGTVASNGTLDPPLGGYKYQGKGSGFPTQDFNPFYWDEYFSSSGTPSPGSPEFQEYQRTQITIPASPLSFTSAGLTSAMGYELIDWPHQSNPGTSQFVDFLVGVTGSCNTIGPTTAPCTYIPIPNTNFTWSSTNGGVTTTKDSTIDPTMMAAALGPLGCGDPLCGELISLADALALTGNTLASFESLGAGSPASVVAEPSALAAFASGFGVLSLLVSRRRNRM